VIFILKPFLKEKILDAAEKGLGAEIELVKLDINLHKGIISLTGFAVDNCKLIKYYNTASAAEIILDIDLPLSLLQKSPVFQSVYLNNFEFGLNNKKRLLPSSETLPSPLKNHESDVSSPQQNILFDTLYIKKLLIENSKFVFEDSSIKPRPAFVKILNINGSIEDILIPMEGSGAFKGNVYLRGKLSSANEGQVKLEGSFTKSEDAVDFDLEIDLKDVNLIRFSTYYSKTSLSILKEAKLDLSSKAICSKNNLNASQKARIYNIELYDLALTEEDKLFGLPAKTVIKFFEDLKNDIAFSFNIVGTIDDPKFDPGPIIKQVLFDAMRDKILAKLQELPRDVIKMGEKAFGEDLKVTETLKALDEDIEESIKSLKKELERIIEH
jgi:hypothetical protein